MTTPPPPPPPQQGPGGPQFGGPPQQPPYGAPQSPYGGAPSPYGAPQPPYGAPPPGGPGGWGGPPPQGPPQGGSGSGRLIAIIAACVAVVVLAVSVTFLVLDDDSSSGNDAQASERAQGDPPSDEPSSSPSAEAQPTDDDAAATPDGDEDKRLSLPRTLLDGDYRLLQDMSDQFQREAPGDDVIGLGGSFRSGEGDSIVVAAYEGNIGSPTVAKREFLRGTGSGATSKITVTPKKYDVDDADSPVTCQVVTQTQGSAEVQLPTCVWADDETLISAIHTDPGKVNTDPKGIKLPLQADRLMDILDDFREADS